MARWQALERDVLAHRYLYYVECAPVLADAAYDQLERKARAACPPESPVHKLGSDLASDYSPEIVNHASTLKGST